MKTNNDSEHRIFDTGNVYSSFFCVLFIVIDSVNANNAKQCMAMCYHHYLLSHIYENTIHIYDTAQCGTIESIEHEILSHSIN